MRDRPTLPELLRLTEGKSAIARPVRGWLRATREALGFSRERIAGTLGVSHAAVRDYEGAELSDAITLRTFKRMAAAMDCELVYALVPRKRSAWQQPIVRPVSPPAPSEPQELATHLK